MRGRRARQLGTMKPAERPPTSGRQRAKGELWHRSHFGSRYKLG